MPPAAPEVVPQTSSGELYIYNYIYKVQINPRTVGFMILYIYTEKDAVRSPFFHVSGNAVFFVTSCWILYVHIPVMILLEIHIDYQTSSGVVKECPESHEDSQGKGRKYRHSVCIYI